MSFSELQTLSLRSFQSIVIVAQPISKIPSDENEWDPKWADAVSLSQIAAYLLCGNSPEKLKTAHRGLQEAKSIKAILSL